MAIYNHSSTASYLSSILPPYVPTQLSFITLTSLCTNPVTFHHPCLPVYQPSYLSSPLPPYVPTQLSFITLASLCTNPAIFHHPCLSMYQPSYLSSPLPLYVPTQLPFITRASLCINPATFHHSCLPMYQPGYLSSLLPPDVPTRQLRSSSKALLTSDNTMTRIGARAFRNSTATLWNNLSEALRHCDTLDLFRSRLNTHLYKAAYEH